MVCTTLAVELMSAQYMQIVGFSSDFKKAPTKISASKSQEKT